MLGLRPPEFSGPEVLKRLRPWSKGVAPAATRDPHAYTPKHLAEKILTSRTALEGERKQVTVSSPT